MKNIVLFGDSITYGYGVFKKDGIAALIQDRFKKFSIINSGLNGDTTRWALKRLNYDVLSFSPYIVTVLFGSNDCAPSENSYITLFEFEKNIDSIIENILNKNCSSNIILITPPPVNENVFMPYTTNRRLLPYCSVIRNSAKKYGCFLCDLNKDFMSEAKENIEKYLQEDGCHLSEDGYKLFYKSLEPVISSIIEKDTL